MSPGDPTLPGRRNFLRLAAGASAASAWPRLRAASAEAAPAAAPGNIEDRADWTAMLQRVVEPVLTNLAAQKLRANMPIEAPANTVSNRRQFTHLEAFGRTLAGLAPWLELADPPEAEKATVARLAELARTCLDHATDPSSPDYLNFKDNGGQPLVDAAFLALALLRAPRALWAKLDLAVQKRVIACLEQTRALKPGQNNWLLFSAMIEATLATVGASWQEAPIETAVRAHLAWYKGDGAYGDGAEFHWDYYNSYVIQPFLLETLEAIAKFSNQWAEAGPKVLARAQRYAAVQERLIAPDGTYPPLGRSLAYRCGAFQLLALMAQRRQLPRDIVPAQVRGALAAVIHRTLGAPDTFDGQGWLRVGLAGHQPGIAENYISTGSLYLCTTAFLPLGLPAGDDFWSGPPTPWTQVKVWSGRDVPADHALREPA
ncbi:MAG TPA: DUF2264 domain-containing protein [Opitutales bacterium]|nr:DUF2264 domain-containing protein [Opitutales bacterium]